MILPRSSSLFIVQKKEILEILSGFESSNTYMLMNSEKEPLAYILEERNGIKSALSRLFLGSNRGFKMIVTDTKGKPWISFERAATFWMSTIVIKDQQGNSIGWVKRQFSILKRIYHLHTSNNAQLGTVESNWNQLYTFNWTLSSIQDSGTITKKWNGVLKELFSDADIFKIIFPSSLNADQYQAILPFIIATGISIDMDFFENNHS
jgi:uncharacterized protein YxjI